MRAIMCSSLVEVVIEFLRLRVNLDLRELYPVNLKIKIAKPIVKVLFVELLKSTKLIILQVHSPEEHGHLEATLIELEF
jgi:hypothetical protein